MTTSADRAMVAQCITGNKWHDISADGKTTLCGHPVWPQSKKVGDVTCGLCLKRKDSDEKILSWLAENMFEGRTRPGLVGAAHEVPTERRDRQRRALPATAGTGEGDASEVTTSMWQAV